MRTLSRKQCHGRPMTPISANCSPTSSRTATRIQQCQHQPDSRGGSTTVRETHRGQYQASQRPFGLLPTGCRAPSGYEVSFSLMHTTGKGSGNSGKSNKRQKTSHGQQQMWGADKGKGKGKQGKKGAKMQPLWAAIPKAIRDLGGVANLPSGEPICFDYSLHGDRCRCKADSCPRKHVCAKCFGDHPLKDHKD